MAEQVDDLELATPVSAPWEAYSDGRAWKLKRGEDFSQPVVNARDAFRKWAYRKDLQPRVRIVDADTLVVRVDRDD